MDEKERKHLESLVEQFGRENQPGSGAWARLEKARHEELLPKPWYRTGIGWIAFLTLLATLAGIAVVIFK